MKVYYGEISIANSNGKKSGLIIAKNKKKALKLLREQTTDPFPETTHQFVSRIRTDNEAFISLVFQKSNLS